MGLTSSIVEGFCVWICAMMRDAYTQNDVVVFVVNLNRKSVTINILSIIDAGRLIDAFWWN